MRAELVLERRRTYRDPLESRHFLDPAIEENYPEKDDHTVHYGEILSLQGDARFLAGR